MVKLADTSLTQKSNLRGCALEQGVVRTFMYDELPKALESYMKNFLKELVMREETPKKA